MAASARAASGGGDLRDVDVVARAQRTSRRRRPRPAAPGAGQPARQRRPSQPRARGRHADPHRHTATTRCSPLPIREPDSPRSSSPTLSNASAVPTPPGPAGTAAAGWAWRSSRPSPARTRVRFGRRTGPRVARWWRSSCRSRRRCQAPWSRSRSGPTPSRPRGQVVTFANPDTVLEPGRCSATAHASLIIATRCCGSGAAGLNSPVTSAGCPVGQTCPHRLFHPPRFPGRSVGAARSGKRSAVSCAGPSVLMRRDRGHAVNPPRPESPRGRRRQRCG